MEPGEKEITKIRFSKNKYETGHPDEGGEEGARNRLN